MSALNAKLAKAKAKEAEGTYRGYEDDDDEEEAKAAAEEERDPVLLMLCVMELLSKGRLLYHLFDNDAEGVSKRLHSVLPVQPQDPSLCPFEKKKEYNPSQVTTYSAVLCLLAPVQPEYLKLSLIHI